MFVFSLTGTSMAADISAPLAVKAPAESQIYDWTGFYVGGHVGLALGNSNWTANATTPGAPPVSGSLSMYQSPNAFYESGSWLLGVQGGYNLMLHNRGVLGLEADATFPTFQNLSGLSTGGITKFTSPTLGAATYSETMLSSGTVRGRIGYAPGIWLFYATGGFAWTYDSRDLTQLGPGVDESRLLWRFGWAAGASVEVPIAPSWTVRGEFLWMGFPTYSLEASNAALLLKNRSGQPRGFGSGRLVSPTGFNRMCKENTGTKGRNKCSKQINHRTCACNGLCASRAEIDRNSV
jgi:high affinity Mn2+ porin